MNEIIEKLKKVKDTIILEKGDTLRLSLLIARTDMESKWDLFMSGDWLKKNNSEKDLIYVIEKLKAEFNENLDFLSQIVLLVPTDDFFKALARAIKKENRMEGEIKDLRISSGFVIKQMYLISSNLDQLELGEDIEVATPPEKKDSEVRDF